MTLDHVADDAWAPLRTFTPARIGLGAAGVSEPVGSVLRFKADHALARDAVHIPLDVDAVVADLEPLGLGPVHRVSSQARDRGEYLRRPDLGRIPADTTGLPHTGADVGLVIADGLSAQAIARHAVPLVEAMLTVFDGRYRIAPPVVATQARVAIGDHIGAALGVQTVLVLIGERPGLSVSDSVGIYLTHHPVPGRTDADRNCISNIHGNGLSYAEAAAVCAALVEGARRLGRSGVDLKDTSRGGALAEGASPELAR
ncbi:ethanolamine ammonia-lyase small subunit [Mycolicibacterium phlei]|jgi:ethanolamine ammonia-lyase small subunit|uniref:Ethanolamine ammonia-lyase small subunit n=1 Tax=Mycolicibacterium phlei DSM 43239 = CCUG 21000 TaxID=1226750 RepID=A0A5N5UUB9_MYCPH|nr:ethanolamine ammonia-lyase subunit EutC [Mycolicibacterium phlei]VEG08202.1 ethanolamine ammonia-lyase small subunit [Mycobacteroides chelonae]AMO60081.1 Ethanolamine ammonia-lyase light chain [Mycolicibacterium phlei]EID16783.1 ethanolamine ammonia-lyase small subunit [Mycolicibacterium phlei RIVM601174]KAB7751740.1 ethanolamine ammonia-lyase small subunit [Mycolicibacterium phlei DSM 43239 = CCUG 21000]KXW60325.1 ethanolamine ammonia-lyase small subunit [Mycolicibacterium phlei DSM 43239 